MVVFFLHCIIFEGKPSSKDEELVEIFVKMPDGEMITFNADVEGNTVGDVKMMAQGILGLPRNVMRFIFADETLEDGRTLSEYNITEGSTINVVLL